LFFALFFNSISFQIIAQQTSDEETNQQTSTFDYIYQQKYAEFEEELNNIGFDSLYFSNKWFRKLIKWKNKTQEELWPHDNFLTKYEIDQQYFVNLDLYPVADEDCVWRELGPLNDHDWEAGYHAVEVDKLFRGIGPMNFISFDPNFETTNLVFTGGWRSGLFYSDDAGENWHSAGTDNLPPPVSAADCQSSPFNSDAWFVATGAGDGYFGSGGSRSSGLYRTFNKGETWELIGSPQDLGGQNAGGYDYWGWNLKRVLIDPNSSEDNLTIFITGSKGIYRATNAMGSVGENGETDNLGWDNRYPEDKNETIQFDGETYTLSKNWSYDITYKQNDDGSYDSQNLFATGTKRYELELEDTTLIVDKAYLLHSTDNGTTWNELIPFDDENNLFDFQRFIVRTSPDNFNTIFFSGVDSRNHIEVWNQSPIYFFRLFKYDLNQGTWSSIDSKGWNINTISGFDISPINDSIIHSCLGVTKTTSTDGGITWSQRSGYRVDIHPDVEEIQFQPDGNKVWYAHHGGISIYDIASDTWEVKIKGLNGAEVLGFSTSRQSPEKITIGLYHDGVMVSGGGYSSSVLPKWKQVKKGDGEETLIDFINDSISYVSAQTGEFRKNTDWWENNGQSMGIPGKRGWYAPLEANEFDPRVLYAASRKASTPGGNESKLNIITYRHLNRGIVEGEGAKEWKKISTFDSFNPLGDVGKLHISVADKNLIFVLVNYADDQGNNTGRRVFANTHAMEEPEEMTGSWFEIPSPSENHENHWAPDIVSDPEDANIFFVLPGGAHLQGENSDFKVARYTYKGENNMMDELQSIDIVSNGFDIEDLTYNLPNIDVQQLFIIPGERTYYIATNYDVWTTNQDKIDNAGINQEAIVWERLGTNLPHVQINRMEVGYQYNLIRIGLNGRGVWEHCLPCNAKPGEVVISEDKIIETFARYNKNVKITNNATLTITGEVQMVEGTSITIEPGSRLIIDGGTITNACGGLWDGIYVEGISAERQIINTNNNNQGHLKILNGATIKNAVVAARNYGILPDGSPDASKRGGVIRAKKSYFINNQIDVRFLPFFNKNSSGAIIADKSYFRGCDFIDNNEFISGENPEVAIELNRVHLISIKGCTFSDNRSNLLYNNYKTEDPGPPKKATLGIVSFGATFVIDTYESSSGDSITGFNNLQYAIRAFTAANLKSPPTGIEIENAVFNSFKGIYLNGIEDAVINNNNFIVKADLNTTGEDELYPYGLYLDMCQNYTVQENTFNAESQDDKIANTYGMVVNNRHGGAEEVYKNSFDNFYVGTEAVGQNKNENPLNKVGLQLLCNNYSNGAYDIAVLPDFDNVIDVGSPPAVVGIAYEQGEMSNQTDKLAGNLFSFSNDIQNNIENNYLNKGDNLVYFHHDPKSNLRVFPFKYSKESITLVQIPSNQYNPDNSCPIKDGSGEESVGGKEQRIAQLKTTVDQSTTEVAEIDYQLSTLVDGGNTTQMENDVVLTSNADAWRKYQELMANAGYLSEEVLDEVSKKETGFNKAMIRNVLVANPQAAKSEKVQENLDNRGNQLPDYMRDQIDLGLTKLSPKEYLDLAKAMWQTKYYRSISELVQLLKSDTSNDRSVEIVAALSNTGDVAFDYKLVEYYDATNQANLADALLNVINGYTLSESQQQFYEKYTDFRNLTRQWQQNDIDMDMLDNGQLMQLEKFAELNSRVAAKAIALQQLNSVYTYYEPVYEPALGGGDKSNRDTRRKRIVVNENKMLLFPNPADGYFTVEYQLTDAFKSAQVIIFDINGKLITNFELHNDIDQIIIPTENWPSGQYSVSILADGKTIMHKMITLVK
jgi:hypothetical protein